MLAALAGARIADALNTPGGLVLDATAYAWAALVALWLAGLPFALLGWRASRRAGLSRQSLPGWFADQGKSLAIGAVLGPIALTFLVVGAAHLAARLVGAGDRRLDRARAACSRSSPRS